MRVSTSSTPSGFDEALASARGGAITRDQARALVRAREGRELESLMEVAARLRDRLKGRLVSYSKKVFIPLTNLCRDYCGYCTFRKDPGQAGAHTMTPDEVLAVAEAGARLGCKEALFSLGDRPEALFPEMRETLERFGHRTTLSYLAEMCERVLNETSLLPHANAGLMGRHDLSTLRQFSPSMGLMLESASDRLAARGMPHDNAPDKAPRLRLKTIEEAGRLRIPFTTGILIGIGETLDERIDSLLAIRELHDRYGHIQEVIIQNFRAKADIPMRLHPEPPLTDLARTVAVARIILREVNVQAPPNLSDEDYPFLIKAGLNDWGGISPLTRDFINPEKPWPHIEHLSLRTASEGFELKERLTVYPEFVLQEDFLDPRLAARVRSMADARGYARTEESHERDVADA
ncbi:MAG TPA: 7,8-didemethyl-8-hydroxy-5-deazariboflavin synthase CofG [Blastocatellia bacterium]|jgi:FO synthase|nr:7,8-didemethyl-8-hydroxy-5-deazariboflavin synthase CofG [Blastocatellia bacterium]